MSVMMTTLRAKDYSTIYKMVAQRSFLNDQKARDQAQLTQPALLAETAKYHLKLSRMSISPPKMARSTPSTRGPSLASQTTSFLDTYGQRGTTEYGQSLMSN
jgi:hypothetical protein